MNAEKLKRLQAQVRIGGKGTPRRKKKVVHQTAATDDKKLQSSLKKLSVSTIPGIEEVNIIKDDLSVIHFNNPKAQASLAANTFAITGHGENKKVVEMLPEILPQLGQDTVLQLRRFANNMAVSKTLTRVAEEEDVPTLVGNFDEASKNEAPSAAPFSETQKAAESVNTIDAKQVSKPAVEETSTTKEVKEGIEQPAIGPEDQVMIQKANNTQPLQETCKDGKISEVVQEKEPLICPQEPKVAEHTSQHGIPPTFDQNQEELTEQAERKIELTECPKSETLVTKDAIDNEEKQSEASVQDPKEKKEELKEEKGKLEATEQNKLENDKICPVSQQSVEQQQDTPQEIAHQNENKREVAQTKQEKGKPELVEQGDGKPEPQVTLNMGVKSDDVVSQQQAVEQKSVEIKNGTPKQTIEEQSTESKDITPHSREAKIEDARSDTQKPETPETEKTETADFSENKVSDPNVLSAEEEKRAIFVEIKSPAEASTPKPSETDKSNMQLVEKKNLQIVEKPDMAVSIVQPPIIPPSGQLPSPPTEEKPIELSQPLNKPETITAEKEKVSMSPEGNKPQEGKRVKQEKPDISKKPDNKKGEKAKAKTPPPQKKGEKPQQKVSGKQTPQGKRTPVTSESESKTEETVPKKAAEDKSAKSEKPEKNQPKVTGKQTPQGKRTPATSESEQKEESVEKKISDKPAKAAPEKPQAKQSNHGKRTPATSESETKCDETADKKVTATTQKVKTEESSGGHQQQPKNQPAQGKGAQPITKTQQQQQKKPQPKKQDDAKGAGGEQTKQSPKSCGKPQQKPGASVPSVVKKEVGPEQAKKAN